MLPVAKQLGSETKTNKKKVTNNGDMYKFSHFNPERCLMFDNTYLLTYLLHGAESFLRS